MRNHILRLEKGLFYFLLFCLPFESRLIVKEWGGEFNEWNSAFLYLTDLLILAILFFWAYRSRLPRLALPKNAENIVLGLFFLAAAASLFGAQNLELGAYQLIKLLEFILLFFYLKANFKKLFNLELVLKILLISALFQVGIGIFQFSLQHDLNLKIFGESPLSPNIDGAAKIEVSGVKMIRAYGTFPHPNVFAAFLLFSIFAFYLFFLKTKKLSFWPELLYFSIFFFLVFGLFLTFSRTFIVLFIAFSVLIFLILFFKKDFYQIYRKRTMAICLFFLFSIFLCVGLMNKPIYSRFIISAVDPSVSLRYFYNSISLSIIRENPFFGVGIGNFVWSLKNFQGSLRAANLIYNLDGPEAKIIPHEAPAWLFQPVHNIFLLILSEIGIIGILAFLAFLAILACPFFKIVKENNLSFIFYLLFFAFLIVFFTDHFFWTLQQGRLMFWILCGILAGLSKVDIPI